MANKNIPQLRFAGFEGEWDRLPLTTYLTTSGEKNRDNVYDKNDVMSVSREFGVVNQIKYQGRSFAGASLAGYGVAKPNDVIYTKSPLRDQPYGIIKTNNLESGIVSALYAIYHPLDNVHPQFVQTYFDSDDRLNDYLRPLVRKGAKNTLNIGDDDALNGNVQFPQKEEQAKITESINVIECQIQQQRELCDKLRKLKSALLTKLFPKAGHTVPEMRMAGFNMPWRMRSVGKIVKPYSDVIPTPKDSYTRLGIRSHGKGTFHEFVPAGAGLETSTMWVVESNNLIVNITFGWELAVAITNDEDKGKLVSHRFPQFSFNKGYEPLFFKYALINDDFRKHLVLASPGSAGRNRVLKVDKMLEYQLPVPVFEEQKAITRTLANYDKLITLNETKLSKLRNLKSAMLDKLFV